MQLSNGFEEEEKRGFYSNESAMGNSNLFQNVDIAKEQMKLDVDDIQVESDAWPDQSQAQVRSNIHKIIREKIS